MAMDKKHEGTGSKAIQNPSSPKAKADSRQAGKGSEDARDLRELCNVESDGTICFGNSCIQLRIKPGDDEIRVKIDRNDESCTGDTKRLVDLMLETVVQGGATVYESKSKAK
jgi:hypothetical protein